MRRIKTTLVCMIISMSGIAAAEEPEGYQNLAGNKELEQAVYGKYRWHYVNNYDTYDIDYENPVDHETKLIPAAEYLEKITAKFTRDIERSKKEGDTAETAKLEKSYSKKMTEHQSSYVILENNKISYPSANFTCSPVSYQYKTQEMDTETKKEWKEEYPFKQMDIMLDTVQTLRISCPYKDEFGEEEIRDWTYKLVDNRYILLPMHNGIMGILIKE